MSYKELQEVYLGDVAEEITVGFVGSMTSEYKDSGVPFLRSLNVKQYKVNLNSVKFVDREFHQKLKKSALKPGDVVIVRTGKPGTSTVIPDWLAEANCSDLVIVRPGNNLDSNFLAAYINTIATSHIDAHTVGAVQQHFNVASAKKMEIKLPPIEIQRKIGKIISNLNDKIEVNEKIVNLLEQISNELFKSWFIDFEFPNEKGEPYKSSGGKMVKSELGEIPKEWKVIKMGEILTKSSEKVGERKVEGYSTTNTGVFPRTDKFKKDLSKDISKNKIVYKDNIVFGISRQILNFGIMVDDIGYVSPAYHVFTIDHEKYLPTLLEMNIRINEPHFRDLIKPGSREGQGVDLHAVEEKKIILPDIQVQKNFYDLVNLCKAEELKIENQKLEQLRDTLLPKLLSGEIEIPDDLEVE